MPGPSWMSRYSLENLLSGPTVADDPTFGGGGTDPATMYGNRLQGLARQKGRMLRSQSASPLGESERGFYDNMAAINQGIAALGQKAAKPGAPLQIAPDRGRVSTMNPLQAGYNAERLHTARAGASRAAAQDRDLQAGNLENLLMQEHEMADPSFGDLSGIRARRLGSLGRQSMGGF